MWLARSGCSFYAPCHVAPPRFGGYSHSYAISSLFVFDQRCRRAGAGCTLVDESNRDHCTNPTGDLAEWYCPTAAVTNEPRCAERFTARGYCAANSGGDVHNNCRPINAYGNGRCRDTSQQTSTRTALGIEYGPSSTCMRCGCSQTSRPHRWCPQSPPLRSWGLRTWCSLRQWQQWWHRHPV